ncbi:four helix bundle protein [Rhizobium sp. CC-YZS058]|uniref:four helix bundle protein n=1 Tax=Rhizobium sp. CC-YZS058 TaxID=3042153 RepID=UPI002B05E2F5|nr:four helix bundle protein [Rhizobium sp. CC-YZS058]MEA3535243.1 four helix bundle protein [Rhizobium sp. CC-YZS058]
MGGERIASYRDLKVWQLAIDISIECYDLTQTLPRSELFGMTSQIRRSSVSIAANIAEGYGRESRSGFIQFLKIAQGSLKELETHLIIASRVGLLAEADCDPLLGKCEENGRMISGLIRAIERKQREE